MRSIGLLLVCGVLLTACGSYRQNIMFKVSETDELKALARETEKNYVIQPNDFLKLSVYTQGGELIIDPEFKLLENVNAQILNQRPNPDYLVNTQGIAKFPKVGEIKLDGLTIREAEARLQTEYSKFYTEPFVVLQYTNKRVVVLGAPGGKVIPLTNENTTLLEVIALTTIGVENNSKANNIRVLRGNDVFVADFSTIAGYKTSNIIMQSGDVVYIEPIRRPLSEAVRDYGPFVSILTSLTTLLVVLFGVN